MWNPNIKVINITKLVQMIFNTWLEYFEYIGYLSCSITLIILNECIDLINIHFNWSTWLWKNVQQEISCTKLRRPLLTRSQHLLHTLHKSLCISVYIFCCYSVTKSCPTLCNSMDWSTLGFPVLHYLPQFAQTHILESVMLSNYLILCWPLLLLSLIFPRIKVFSSELARRVAFLPFLK